MAEGWARYLHGETVSAFSAGIEKHGMNPRAVTVMAEVGIDISRQQSKLIDELDDLNFDYVITLCDHARESCPLFPGRGRSIHVGFPDPPALAHDAQDEEEKLMHYRRVRDEIRAFVEKLPEMLERMESGEPSVARNDNGQ
jgi:arsenate reductase (thioredoxin)